MIEDPCGVESDFPCYELWSSSWTFMIEGNSAGNLHVISLAVNFD
jgi:hypothetical protein